MERGNFIKRKKFIAGCCMSVILICAVVWATLLLMSEPNIYSDNAIFSPEIEQVRKNVRVVINGASENRTLHLNTSEWYCKYAVFYGGSNPEKRDLAYPGAQIAFFFLEDLNQTMADNYGDVIIRMNPVIENGTMKIVIAAFFEGGYEKFVYYGENLLFHYRYIGYETRHYESALIELQGE